MKNLKSDEIYGELVIAEAELNRLKAEFNAALTAEQEEEDTKQDAKAREYMTRVKTKFEYDDVICKWWMDYCIWSPEANYALETIAEKQIATAIYTANLDKKRDEWVNIDEDIAPMVSLCENDLLNAVYELEKKGILETSPKGNHARFSAGYINKIDEIIAEDRLGRGW